MTTQPGRSILSTVTTVAVALTLGLGAPAAAAHPVGTEPGLANRAAPLVDATTELIDQLNDIGWPAESAYNVYTANGAPTTIVFGTPGQPTTYRNETPCATFVRRLLTHVFPSWATSSYVTAEFGASFPNSALFHDALAADRAGTDDVPRWRGFNPSFLIGLNVQPGDVMAIKYAGGGSGSGHMAIIGPGSHLYNDSHPSCREWAIRVMDSTNSPHGDPGEDPAYPDTRHYYDAAAHEWREGTGAGMGWMFIRTSRATGQIVAHRWSSSSSTWYDQTARSIIFGRYDPYA